MSLRARLEEDQKQAMRNRDSTRLAVIRYLRSEIHNAEIARQTSLDEEEITAVLSRQAQQRRDSIEAFTSGNRQDLVDKEKAELTIILEYLPEQMSREEITELVQRAVEEVGATGAGDVGKVMGVLMPQVRGKAEGREVSSIVSETLNSLIDQP